MNFAYADPPYLGCGRLYRKHHPDADDWDDPEQHRLLFQKLFTEYPDGWAMSLSSVSLPTLLPMAPPGTRIGVWVKPFCSFKPGVNPAYAWEPVLFHGGRKRDRKARTVRDFVSANITLKKGLTGAKPEAFSRWVFDLLGAKRGDTLTDLFPGTGAVTEAWKKFTDEEFFMRLEAAGPLIP